MEAEGAVAQVGRRQEERSSLNPTATTTTRSWSPDWSAAAVAD